MARRGTLRPGLEAYAMQGIMPVEGVPPPKPLQAVAVDEVIHAQPEIVIRGSNAANSRRRTVDSDPMVESRRKAASKKRVDKTVSRNTIERHRTRDLNERQITRQLNEAQLGYTKIDWGAEK